MRSIYPTGRDGGDERFESWNCGCRYGAAVLCNARRRIVETLKRIGAFALAASILIPGHAGAVTCDFTETWAHATVKSYSNGQVITPDNSAKFFNPKGWFVLKDPSNCPADVAQILASDELFLQRNCPDGEADSSVGVGGYLQAIPVDSTSTFTFEETGEIDFDLSDSDTAHEVTVVFCPTAGGPFGSSCRGIVYVLQRGDDYEPPFGIGLEYILLPQDSGTYVRNLYDDFVASFGEEPTGLYLTGIAFDIFSLSFGGSVGSGTLGALSVCRGATTVTAPTSLSATSPTSSEVALSWAHTGSDVTGFTVERKTGNGAFSQIAVSASPTTHVSDTTVTPATTYSYRVRAYKGATYSGYSNEVTIKSTAPCGDADENGIVAAGDALRILRKAVGQSVACPVYVCDSDNSTLISSTDALRVLKESVGQTIALTCAVRVG